MLSSACGTSIDAPELEGDGLNAARNVLAMALMLWFCDVVDQRLLGAAPVDSTLTISQLSIPRLSETDHRNPRSFPT